MNQFYLPGRQPATMRLNRRKLFLSIDGDIVAAVDVIERLTSIISEYIDEDLNTGKYGEGAVYRNPIEAVRSDLKLANIDEWFLFEETNANDE